MPFYTSLIERLQTQHLAIEPIISAADEEKYQHRPATGKWNIHDNMAHLARYQQVFRARLQQIISTNNPAFGRYRAEDDPNFESWQLFQKNELLSTLHNDRNELVSWMLNFNEAQLERTATHPKFGKMNIITWTEFFLLHEAHHLYTIFQLANSHES